VRSDGFVGAWKKRRRRRRRRGREEVEVVLFK